MEYGAPNYPPIQGCLVGKEVNDSFFSPKGGAYSVSTINILIGQVFALFWSIILAYHFHTYFHDSFCRFVGFIFDNDIVHMVFCIVGILFIIVYIYLCNRGLGNKLFLIVFIFYLMFLCYKIIFTILGLKNLMVIGVYIMTLIFFIEALFANILGKIVAGWGKKGCCFSVVWDRSNTGSCFAKKSEKNWRKKQLRNLVDNSEKCKELKGIVLKIVDSDKQEDIEKGCIIIEENVISKIFPKNMKGLWKCIEDEREIEFGNNGKVQKYYFWGEYFFKFMTKNPTKAVKFFAECPFDYIKEIIDKQKKMKMILIIHRTGNII